MSTQPFRSNAPPPKPNKCLDLLLSTIARTVFELRCYSLRRKVQRSNTSLRRQQHHICHHLQIAFLSSWWRNGSPPKFFRLSCLRKRKRRITVASSHHPYDEPRTTFLSLTVRGPARHLTAKGPSSRRFELNNFSSSQTLRQAGRYL